MVAGNITGLISAAGSLFAIGSVVDATARLVAATGSCFFIIAGLRLRGGIPISVHPGCSTSYFVVSTLRAWSLYSSIYKGCS